MNELYSIIINEISDKWALVDVPCPVMIKEEIAMPGKQVEAGILLSEASFDHPSHMNYLHIRTLMLTITVNPGNPTHAQYIREELLRILSHLRTPPIINLEPTMAHDYPESALQASVIMNFHIKTWVACLP